MTKKVLILVPDLNKPGGVTTYFLALQDQFRTYEATYFVRGSRKNTPKPLIPLVILWDYIRYFFTLLFSHFDVIHVNVSLGKRNLARDPYFVSIAKLLNKRVLLFIHGWDKDCESLSKGNAVQRLLKADKIVVLAEEFKESVLSWGFQGEVYVRPTVVARDIENAVTPDDLSRRFDAEEMRLLFLSRVEPEKGIQITLETFQLLLKDFPNLQLDVAGSGSALEQSQAYVRDENIPNVHFHGYIMGDDKIKAFQNAHIYFFPTSHGEGMPISVLEAMMCGLPVVTRPMGGLKDFFTSDMGVITESTNASDYYDTLAPMIREYGKIKEIAEHNFTYARKRFTVDHTIADLESMYDSLIEEK